LFATKDKDWKSWDYIVGDYVKTSECDKELFSLSTWRDEHLNTLNSWSKHSMKIAIKDPVTGAWTKWKSIGDFHNLKLAYDIHRTILPNEIIAESDYPTYEENWEASKILGRIVEDKGFIPHYYYSGSKSIHMHLYFDWTCLYEIDEFLKDKLLEFFKYGSFFKRKFIRFLREKVLSCWDTNIRVFDPIVSPKHLIRSALSRNKLGFKTFLGYSYKDLSFVPYICNEENRIYPKIANAFKGEVKLSRPFDIQSLVEEFLDGLNKQIRVGKVKRRSASLMQFFGEDKLPGCVEFMLSEDFASVGDGYKLFHLSHQHFYTHYSILLQELNAMFHYHQLLQLVPLLYHHLLHTLGISI